MIIHRYKGICSSASPLLPCNGYSRDQDCKILSFPEYILPSFCYHYVISDHLKSKGCLFFFSPTGQVTIKFQQLLWTPPRKFSFPFLTLLLKFLQIFSIFPTSYHCFFASLPNSCIGQLIKLRSSKFYFVPPYVSHCLPLQVSSFSILWSNF